MVRSIATAVLGIALIVVAAPTNAALLCQAKTTTASSPVGPVPWVNRKGALKAAKGAWEARITNSSMSVWNRARDKKEACNRTANGFGGYNWSCTVRARACANVIECEPQRGFTCH